MKITLLQLFNVVDWRLATTIDDVYSILNYIFDENFMTHELPWALKVLQEKRPEWFVDAESKINLIKTETGNDFQKIYSKMKDLTDEYEISKMQPL